MFSIKHSLLNLSIFKTFNKILQRNSPKLPAFRVMSVNYKPEYDYFLVLDFEATCDDKTKIYPQEIIEFPVLKMNAKSFKIESQFHQYVQPTYNPRLTSFCTELTGIVQEQIEDVPTLQETLKLFDDWMIKENLLKPNSKSLFVTCGDWDLKVMLPGQCKHLQIEVPSYFKSWMNIKMPFCELTGIFPKGLMGMLGMLELKHVGRLHSGIDDCQNIVILLKALAERYGIMKATTEFQIPVT